MQGYPSLAKGDRFRAYSRRSSRVQIPSLAPFIIKIVSRRYNCSKGLNKRIRIGFPTNAKEGTQMVMERIDLKKAQAIAKNKGIKPGKVKGTEGVQFT